jgi:predicted nucleotidyltransferase
MNRPSSAIPAVTPPVTPPATAPTAAEVLLLLRANRDRWADRFHLRRIGLFGSVVRGESTASSDVDVWVELDPLTPFATVHLKQELEELLQRPVDLVRLRERMNPVLRQVILMEGVSA